MRFEPLNYSDREAVLTLWNRCASFDPINEQLLEEKIWRDTAFDPTLAIAAKLNDALRGFAVAVLRERQGELMGFIKLLAVDPTCQREGIATHLVSELESRLGRHQIRALRVCESAPNYLTPGVDERYAATRHFFESMGYQQVGKACNLIASLSDQEFSTRDEEDRLAQLGIEVRRADSQDEPSVLDFLAKHWRPWVPEVQVAFSNNPVSVHTASAGGNLIGFAAYDCNNLGTGWFGPMGTALEARGKGVGAVLLNRCLRDLKSQGHTTAIIPWVGPVAFYEKHCRAKVSRTFIRFEKRL